MSINAVSSASKAVGSQTALAKALGCTPQNVQWMCATGNVPAKHVLKIEAVSGISRSLLRPDLYPDHLPTLDETIQAPTQHRQTDESAVNPSSAEVA